MIVGKYLKNTALYSPDELERLDKHIEKYFGKCKKKRRINHEKNNVLFTRSMGGL